MDVSQIIDSLDSLWFFSNVVSSSTNHEIQLGRHVSPELLVQREETSKPMNQTEENQKNEEESPGTETLVLRCPKCGEFAAEIEPQVVEKQVGLQETEQQEELANKTEETKKGSSGGGRRRRRTRRRRSKRSLLQERRQVYYGDLDLGFYGQMEFDDDDDEYSPWLLYPYEEETKAFEYQRQHHHHQVNMKMPPLNDGLAMKQHLKSWAYAVACTVR